MSGQAFEYHAEAIQEAWDAFHWYDERSDSAAESFWEELTSARQSVTRHPKSWAPYLHGTRFFKLKRFPYALVYIDQGDRIIGVAVAHLKRRPGYWQKRLVE
jgi:plasmid stabilization system protein ParE